MGRRFHNSAFFCGNHGIPVLKVSKPERETLAACEI